MQKWLGQFKREWLIMKPSIVIYALVNLLVVVGGALLLTKGFTNSIDWFDNILIISGFWLIIGIFIGTGILFRSLEGEMKQPYIWLHSSSSILALISVKVVFATLITVILLMWTELIMVMMFMISDAALPVSNSKAFIVLGLVLMALVLDSVFITAVAFFFWSVYRVFHTRTKTFGFVIAFGLFWIAAYLWEKVRAFGLFKGLAELWPFHLMDSIPYEEPSKYFFVTAISDGVVVSGGSLVFYMLLSLVLILAGAVLFEKKARL